MHSLLRVGASNDGEFLRILVLVVVVEIFTHALVSACAECRHMLRKRLPTTTESRWRS